MSITKEQIFAIADALNKDGIKPTLAAVRRRLGSGSFTTISEVMQEWKVIRLINNEMPQDNIPSSVKALLQRFGDVLWNEAINTANNRLNQEYQTRLEQFNEKETYYNELEKLASDYNSELEAAKVCIENLRYELKTTLEKFNIQEKECALTKQSLYQERSTQKALEQSNNELKQEVNRANKMIDELQNNLTELINSLNSTQNQFNDKFSSKNTKKSADIHHNN